MNKITTLLCILCALLAPAACFGESFIQLSSGVQPVVMAEPSSMIGNNLPTIGRYSRGTKQITKQSGSTNVSASISYGGSYSASPLSRKKGTTAAALSGGSMGGGLTTAMVGGHNGPTTTYDAPSGSAGSSLSNISKVARPDGNNTGNVPLNGAETGMVVLALLYAAYCFVRVRKHSAQA